MMKRTSEQNKKIYAILNRLNKEIGKENAETLKTRLCVGISGQGRSSELSVLEAEELIARLTENCKSGNETKIERESESYNANDIDRKDMMMWIEESFGDLFELQNIKPAARENYRNNFIKRILYGKTQIVNYRDKYAVFEALKASIARLTNQEKIGEMLQELADRRGAMNGWENTAINDYIRQWFRFKKLDSAAKIKKIIQMYNKYCGKTSLGEIAKRKENSTAKELTAKKLTTN